MRDFLDVYVATLQDSATDEALVPKERDDEVRATKNGSLQREKYFVWRLLESALMSSLGLTLGEAGLYKSDGGKWLSHSCEISLSHSGELIAVAISSAPCGIDVEKIICQSSPRFAERTLTEKELARYSSLAEDDGRLYLTECWTKKEALFKCENLNAFVPRKYDSESPNAVCRHIELCGKTYVLAVASENINLIEYKQTV